MKTKPRLSTSLLRRVLCRLGFHTWWPIYTLYDNVSPGYKIEWKQYCPFCPAERDNPLAHY